MRVRNATEEELPEIKAECKKRFRAQGPFEMTICLSHAKRRRLNDGQKKKAWRFRVRTRSLAPSCATAVSD